MGAARCVAYAPTSAPSGAVRPSAGHTVRFCADACAGRRTGGLRCTLRLAAGTRMQFRRCSPRAQTRTPSTRCARAQHLHLLPGLSGPQVFGDTPLHCAAAADCVPAARALLNAGASATAANNFGKAPRDKAASGAMRALLGAPAQTGPAGGASATIMRFSARAASTDSLIAAAQARAPRRWRRCGRAGSRRRRRLSRQEHAPLPPPPRGLTPLRWPLRRPRPPRRLRATPWCLRCARRCML